MNKQILALLANALINALDAYVKSTESDIDDKAVALVKSVLKYFGII